MKVDAFVIRLRRRSDMESADLGVRLCQSELRAVFFCFWLALLPVAVLFARFVRDRTVAADAGAVVGETLARSHGAVRTVASRVWSARPRLEMSGVRNARSGGASFCARWTTRRLSPWRSFTQPVYQLEGLSGRQAAAACSADPHAVTPASLLLVTSAFSPIELALTPALGVAGLLVCAAGIEPI